MFSMKKIIVFAGVFVLLISAAAVWHFLSTEKGQSVAVNDTITEKLPDVLDVQVTPQDLASYTGDPIDNVGNDPFLKEIPPDYFKKYTQELTDLKKSLGEKPANFDQWLRVGIIKKIFNNYIGARDAWEYAKKINPFLSVSYFNLGELYGWYFKDFTKAEDNYLKAIETDPALAQVYIGLANFYTYVYKAKADQTDDVLRRGLKELPDNEELKRALDYYLANQAK